jgi:hypothetical protein
MATKRSEIELRNAALSRLDASGAMVEYNAFVQELQENGDGNAVPMLNDMKRRGELRYELREHPDNPNKRVLFVGRPGRVDDIPF